MLACPADDPSGESPRPRDAQSGQAALLWIAVVLGALLAGGALATFWIRGNPPAATASESVGPVADARAAAPDTVAESGSTDGSSGPLDLEQVRQIVGALSAEDRQKVLGDDDAFAQFVAREALRRSVLGAAREANLDDNERVAFLMRRGAEQVLVDAYLRLRTRGGSEEGIPSDEQVRTFYANNKERFVIPERVPMWQIFFRLPEGADDAAVAAAVAEAAGVVAGIRSGTLSFEEAVAKHSDHAPSRAVGGFMGTPPVATLLPAIRDALPTLAEGDVSDPLRSESGVHVVRRGALLLAETRPFEAVRDQIAVQMRRAAQARLQQSVLAEVQKERGQSLGREQAEQWRQSLAESIK